jgi:hypothetical protein
MINFVKLDRLLVQREKKYENVHYILARNFLEILISPKCTHTTHLQYFMFGLFVLERQIFVSFPGTFLDQSSV